MTKKELEAKVLELTNALEQMEKVEDSLLTKSEIFYLPLKAIQRNSKEYDYNTYMLYFDRNTIADKSLPLTDATCIIKYNRIKKSDGQFVGDTKEKSGMMSYVIGQTTFDDLENYGFTMTKVSKEKMQELTEGFKPKEKTEKPKKTTYKDYLN